MRDAGYLLAVDPSLVSVGAALFQDGALVACACVREEGGASEKVPERAQRVATSVARWLVAVGARPRTLVIEDVVVYPGARGNRNPNQLLGCARVGSALAGMLALGLSARDLDLQLLSYKPAEWTGQLPKARSVKDVFESPRARRIMERLSAEERPLVPRQHDVLDAVGLGLHALGRLAPRRAHAGASRQPRAEHGAD
jgi:hypothetical protein